MGFDISRSGLPKKILIGPFEHRVTFKDLSPAGDKPVHGCYCFEDLELAFHPYQASKTFAADSVIHEIMHGIWRVNVLSLERVSVADSEEKIVTIMSTGFLQVLQANPIFARWLLKHA